MLCVTMICFHASIHPRFPSYLFSGPGVILVMGLHARGKLTVLGHFDSITARFFSVPAARFHLFSFFCFLNTYDSRSLKCLFRFVCVGARIIASSMISSRVSYFVIYVR